MTVWKWHNNPATSTIFHTTEREKKLENHRKTILISCVKSREIFHLSHGCNLNAAYPFIFPPLQKKIKPKAKPLIVNKGNFITSKK